MGGGAGRVLGAACRAPAPARILAGRGSAAGARLRALCGPCPQGAPLGRPFWARALALLEALSALSIGSQPEISLPALSVFLITLKHIHTHTREQTEQRRTGEEGKKKPENERRSGPVGGFNT